MTNLKKMANLSSVYRLPGKRKLAQLAGEGEETNFVFPRG